MQVAGRDSLVKNAVAEVWLHRELLRALVSRNLKMRYQRSVIGFAWALLNPLFTVLILVTVFRVVLRIDVESYWAFLISGYFAWVFVLHTLGTSPSLITAHSYMIRSLAFPGEVLVVSAVLSRLVEFLIELALVVVVLCVFHLGGVPASLVAVPLLIVLHVLLTAGFALPLAAVSVFFHDVQHAVPVVLTLLSFLSPVYYPLRFVPEELRAAFLANPFAVLIRVYHVILYEGRFPAAGEWALLAGFALVIFAAGVALFRWRRAYFAELV
jgi:ABC-type polysaccharide/polyol phosphate export permease